MKIPNFKDEELLTISELLAWTIDELPYEFSENKKMKRSQQKYLESILTKITELRNINSMTKKKHPKQTLYTFKGEIK